MKDAIIHLVCSPITAFRLTATLTENFRFTDVFQVNFCNDFTNQRTLQRFYLSLNARWLD